MGWSVDLRKSDSFIVLNVNGVVGEVMGLYCSIDMLFLVIWGKFFSEDASACRKRSARCFRLHVLYGGRPLKNALNSGKTQKLNPRKFLSKNQFDNASAFEHMALPHLAPPHPRFWCYTRQCGDKHYYASRDAWKFLQLSGCRDSRPLLPRFETTPFHTKICGKSPIFSFIYFSSCLRIITTRWKVLWLFSYSSCAEFSCSRNKASKRARPMNFIRIVWIRNDNGFAQQFGFGSTRNQSK